MVAIDRFSVAALSESPNAAEVSVILVVPVAFAANENVQEDFTVPKSTNRTEPLSETLTLVPVGER